MSSQPRWSVVVPYYNEREDLPETLASFLAQTLQPFRLILVDNASNDGSAEICRDTLSDASENGIDVVFQSEPRKGQVHALEAGIAATDTEFVAICDADTRYPPNYLERAEARFDELPADVVALLATGLYNDPNGFDSFKRRLKARIVPHLLRNQCHSGGYGHVFRTDALKQAGGYSKALWPYLRKDHELIHRVLKQGRIVHDPHLWCQANNRRDLATQSRWTLFERILYHATPYAAKDWFFYRFLGPRMAARKQDELSLRNRPWETAK